MLQMDDILTHSGHANHLLIHHTIQSSDFRILLADEFLSIHLTSC